ncbi:MBL fold metallo-hydrolase [Geminocystis sp. NIES-3709]|uniref:MBL fold metallo-hydrolase n=1 Tax=Geminocystis sp. NIES-3709 TaxID=1617448 RepID=UPI0005FCC147|nr:MBL fold metallo-hydrolase [Geminocystis sp. NIES-3709]BAQ66434.1 metallo-beta-lactamase superfamily protein [Geminocystis sp. NIES-3709]
MARLEQKREENIAGNFYVDSTCIDCDTCRWMAPSTFSRIGEQSAVYEQPSTSSEEIKALQALLSCPTASIGTLNPPQKIQQAQNSFPIPIAHNVYHCGYHSEKSFAAASYFIQRKEGNILVDSPKFNPALVKRLEEMGGIKYLYLTHKDDIADHQKFHDHFNCDRILHRDDITSTTQNIEIPLDIDKPLQFESEIVIIPVPGHTKGHTVMLCKDEFLFTGDHLAWSENLNQLIAFKNHCWYSWEKLAESMEKLTPYSFNWVLPGHGRRYYSDKETMRQKLKECIQWIESTLK